MPIRPLLYFLPWIVCISIPVSAEDLSVTLTYLDRFKIEDESEGLTEPSGLALSHGGNALWTVSDDTRKIFKMNLRGELSDKSFAIERKGLEGITIESSGRFLYAVVESGNRIIKLEIDDETEVAAVQLSDLDGFDAVAAHFAGGDDNKGLEAITFDGERESLWVLKEGQPGLLMEVDAELTTIRRGVLLNEDNGFRDDDAEQADLDFSGLAFDARRKRLWIVSDKGQRAYLYDYGRNRVQQSFALGYGKDGEYEEIEKAEGVACDTDKQRLYIVSDKEARLYVYAIR